MITLSLLLSIIYVLLVYCYIKDNKYFLFCYNKLNNSLFKDLLLWIFILGMVPGLNLVITLLLIGYFIMSIVKRLKY